MIKEVLEKYLEFFPEDRPKLKRLIKQLSDGEKLDDRENFNGHIAGDAIILSPDLEKILFIYHLRSSRWQQPGGHFDPGEEGPWESAAREAEEETGVKLARAIGPDKTDSRVPLHIVTGPVMPSPQKKEPHHWHHDFRYGYIAKSEKLGKIQDDGIGEAKWFNLSDALKRRDYGHETRRSVQRMIELIQ